MAGMTHMQHAQPILLSHFSLPTPKLLPAISPDSKTPQHQRRRLSYGLRRTRRKFFRGQPRSIARDLGFSKIHRNSLDAVGDRISPRLFFSLSGIATHLSRLSKISSSSLAGIFLRYSPHEFSTVAASCHKRKIPIAGTIRGKTDASPEPSSLCSQHSRVFLRANQRDLQEIRKPSSPQTIKSRHGRHRNRRYRHHRVSDEKLRSLADNPSLLAPKRRLPGPQRHSIPARPRFSRQILREERKSRKKLIELSYHRAAKVSPESALILPKTYRRSASPRKNSPRTSPDSVQVAYS